MSDVLHEDVHSRVLLRRHGGEAGELDVIVVERGRRNPLDVLRVERRLVSIPNANHIKLNTQILRCARL